MLFWRRKRTSLMLSPMVVMQCKDAVATILDERMHNYCEPNRGGSHGASES